jgi:deoxyribonuclease IV
MLDKIRLGTSGIPPNFWKTNFSKGKDSRTNMPLWIKDIGLNAYEVLYTYGARMREENALKIKENAKKNNIWLTVHAAYYVVLTSIDPNGIKRSQEELLKAVKLADTMDANNVILHPGYYGEDSLKSRDRFIKNLKPVINEMKDLGINKPKISPEIGGKKSQLGSLDDILTICENLENTVPCIDFAHLHARENGSLINKKRYIEVFNEIEKRLGRDVLKNLHCHFYPVEYSDKGEKCTKHIIKENFSLILKILQI